MNPYTNFNLSELLTVIADYNYIKDTGLNEVCEIVQTTAKTEQDNILIIRTLRKAQHYEKANEFLEKSKTKFPNSERLKNAEHWLIFSSKVVNRNCESYLESAQKIIKETSQNNVKTKLIYELTVLITISRLIEGKAFKEAYNWTTKLNPLTLDDKGRKNENGYYYPSNKLQFYTYKAKSLIGMNEAKSYVNWVFEYLKFTEQKREEFVTQIMKSCTYTNNYENTIISELVLSNYLHKFDIDLVSSLKHFPISNKSSNLILLSELSQYLFCPASFVLNKEFNFPAIKPIDSSTKWSGSKDGFYDKYLMYQKDQNIKSCFEYYPFMQIPEIPESILMEDESLILFEELFKGSIKVNNNFDNTPKTFKSDDGKLIGAPDYLVEKTNGQLVVIAEKFSASNSAAASKVYNSDIITLEAYLTKFEHLNIKQACFINWTWSIEKILSEGPEPNINHLYISKVNVKLIDLAKARETLVDQITDKINTLNSGNELKFSDLGFANKCLNCSVYNYCEHKAGTKKELSIPYNV